MLGEAQFNAGNYAEAKATFEKALDLYKRQKMTKESTLIMSWIAKCETKVNEAKDVLPKSESVDFSNTQKLLSNSSYFSNRTDSIDNYIQVGRGWSALGDTVNLRKNVIATSNLMLSSPTTINDIDRQAMMQFATGIAASGLNNYNYSVGKQALIEGRKNNNKTTEATGKILIAKGLLADNKSVEAENHLLETIQFCEKNKDFDAAKKSAQLLIELYSKNNEKNKTLAAYKELNRFNDSFLVYALKNKAGELAQKEIMSGQLEKISLLELAQTEKESRLTKQRNTIWILGIVLICLLGLAWALWRNIQQKQTANYRIRLQGLRTQMNPHFIFNSLNSVNNFISQNDERSANKYISDFSKLMRSVMSNSSEDFIPLQEELNMLKIYLDLENARFKDKFTHEFNIDSKLQIETIWVPPMLIQPYVENAVWHGLRYKETKGKLTVNFKFDNNQLICEVIDNGIGRQQSLELKTKHQKMNNSTGMKNTAERVQILNKLYKIGLEITIIDLIENNVGIGTMARICIPIKIKNINPNEQ